MQPQAKVNTRVIWRTRLDENSSARGTSADVGVPQDAERREEAAAALTAFLGRAKKSETHRR